MFDEMKYMHRWEYRMGIGFLLFWIFLGVWDVVLIVDGFQSGNLILSGFATLLLAWSVWNVYRFQKEIRDYLARRKVGEVAS